MLRVIHTYYRGGGGGGAGAAGSDGPAVALAVLVFKLPLLVPQQTLLVLVH